MTQAVLWQSCSMRAAWLAAEGQVGVSLAAVRAKLNALEVGISVALVSFAAERTQEVIPQCNAHDQAVDGRGVLDADDGARQERGRNGRHQGSFP